MVAVVWFRNDLRLEDNLALNAAIKTDQPILPLYIYDQSCSRPIGAAAKWWLHHSLSKLSDSFKAYGVNLILRNGNSLEVLQDIFNKVEITHIFWHERYDYDGRDQDKQIQEYFENKEIICEAFNGSLMFESMDFVTADKKIYKVFTPFYKNCLKRAKVERPLNQPKTMKVDSSVKIQSDALASWKLLPTKPNWAKGFEKVWKPGEKGAQDLFEGFLNNKLNYYKKERDQPAAPSMSDLSPHIHWGEISLRQLWHGVKIKSMIKQCEESGASFIRQLCWKEFNYYILYHNPSIINISVKDKFKKFPWRRDKTLFEAWCKGQTGYPLIDAGMRQLWETGYMHNRVRLIVGSFLTKNLLISWQEGESWFWDTLVDADIASNPFNWQWVAGCGYDAAPYFRIFNPILQSKKFDPQGKYIRRWVKELRDVKTKDIHEPWLLKEKIKNYPEPIVNYKESREQALEAYYQII